MAIASTSPTDLAVILPIAVSCMTVFGAVVSATGFVLFNRFKLQQLEQDRKADIERRRLEQARDEEHRRRDDEARKQELDVVRAKIEAEATRLRLELEQAKAANRESDDRSRERDERLAEKIANLNGAVIKVQADLENHVKGGGC